MAVVGDDVTVWCSTTADKGKDVGRGSDPAEKAPAVAAAIPCLDRLREELSCAICLDICFEPSTTPCGHSFCKKCLKCAATKCGRRCPKCRELISNARACTVNTVLWNTIQLLFPAEVEARKKALPEETKRDREPRIRSPERSGGRDDSANGSSGRNNARTRISSMRSAARVARLRESDREMMRRMATPSQSEDAAMALRLQREEFMDAFRETQQPQRSTVYLARASLRAMASRAIQQHGRRRS
ncbi:hypothetical protein Taro_009663 [Colocasia esculenta]|uniref:RING-type E3 ubiquitin transferase n=1 Tax=Colocasia esculenta TaxID=4460 RepID=A0A843U6A6_COLES|nr:hypothetical protein [Colocasia esculenta]